MLQLGDGRHALIVADGMGGHQAGEVASQVAVTSFAESLRAESARRPPQGVLERAFSAAAKAVEQAASTQGREGMGTTLVAALVDGDAAWLVYAGDSPAVLILPDAVVRLTREHTVVGEALRQGQISEVEALNHPLRRAVLRALGHDDVSPDFAQVRRLDWIKSGRAVLLLGSDGLFGGLGDAELIEEVWRDNDLEAAVGRLVLKSIENGSDDNVTVAAIGMGQWKRPRVMAPRTAGLVVLGLAIASALGLLGWQFLSERKASGTPLPSPPPTAQATPPPETQSPSPTAQPPSPQASPSQVAPSPAAASASPASPTRARKPSAPKGKERKK